LVKEENMQKFFDAADKIKPAYDTVYNAVLFICKILLIIDIGITSMAVTGRFVSFIPDPAWSEEVVLTCMAYLAVLSAALAIRKGSHIRMAALDRYLPKRLLFFLDLLADVFVSILAIVMIKVGWEYAVLLGSKGTYVSMPSISRFWMYLPVPVAGVAMIIFEIESIYNHLRKFILGKEIKA